MSEGTFDLTSVNINDQKQKTQEQQQTISKKKDVVTSIVPKKQEEKKDENPQKSMSKLPPIEGKKTNMLASTTQGASNQVQNNNQQQQQLTGSSQNNQMVMSKTMRIKSSKSLANVKKIDNLKNFIDQERQNQKDDRNRNNQRKSDFNQSASYFNRFNQEHEKKLEKKTQFLDGYKKKIEQDFDMLYKQDDYENVVQQLKVLENKVKLSGEIRRTEEMLNKEQKTYNLLKYEIEQKQKILNGLNNQIKNLSHVFSTEEEKQKLLNQEQLYAEFQSRLDDEMIVQMSLKNMMETRKKLLLFEKEKSEKMYFKYLGNISSINGHEEKILKNKQKYDNQNKKISHYSSLNAFNLNSRFKELLEDELSEFEDKNALNEIFKHEQERKDEIVRLEKEARKQEYEQQQLERQKYEDKKQYEKRQMEQLLYQKKKNMNELLKVSCVSEIGELEGRKTFLENSKLNLIYIQEEFEDIISQQKHEIEQLKEQLTELKYISKENKIPKKEKQQTPQIQTLPLQEISDNINSNGNKQAQSSDKPLQIIDEDNLTIHVNIEKYEKTLIEETDHLQDKENQVKRLERVVDEISLVFSRILYQLQPQNLKNKDFEIKRVDLRNHITTCGLKLEKIISFLAKKKDSLRVESINTDADNFQPPEYIGINPRSYLRQRDLDEQREYEENQDIKFEYKEDDSGEDEAEKYLFELRKKQKQKSDEEEENEKQNIQ